jgi:hypothetical protein
LRWQAIRGLQAAKKQSCHNGKLARVWCRGADRWRGCLVCWDEAGALEVLLGADDIRGELAERYGYVNRALPDAELDAFVDALAITDRVFRQASDR